MVDLPLNGESSHSGLLSQDVSLHALNDRLGGGLSVQLFGVIFVVDIVADANEFTSIVSAGQKNDSDAEDFSVGNARGIRSVGLKDEFVDADRDRADEKGVEFLVVLIAGKC